MGHFPDGIQHTLGGGTLLKWEPALLGVGHFPDGLAVVSYFSFICITMLCVYDHNKSIIISVRGLT